MRFLFALTMIVTLCLPAAAAEKAAPDPDIPPVVKKLREKVYNLTAEGLKTLSAQVDIPFFSENPMFQSMKILIYFKAPDEQKLDVEGVSDEMRQVFLQELKVVTTYTRYLFGLGSVTDYICSSDITVKKVKIEKYGEVTQIVARPKKPAKPKEPAKDGDKPAKKEDPAKGKKKKPDLGVITIWISKDLKPIRMSQFHEGKTTTIDIKVIEKDKKFLLSEIDYRTSDQKTKEPTKIKIEYKKVKNFWLPSTILLPTPMNPTAPVKVTLKDVKVNEKLPQHLFGKGDKKKKDKDDEF